MSKARSLLRAHAKHRAISPPPSSRQGRFFPPCRGNPVISLWCYAAAFFVDQLNSAPSTHMRIELGTADDETKILEEAADLILKIALNLDQQCPAARSALTEWLSRSLTHTALNQPVCMMRAMPAASLRSLLLICILSTALAWRASMQITGRPSRLG